MYTEVNKISFPFPSQACWFSSSMAQLKSFSFFQSFKLESKNIQAGNPSFPTFSYLQNPANHTFSKSLNVSTYSYPHSPSSCHHLFSSRWGIFNQYTKENFFKHVMPNNLVMGTDLSSLRLSNKKMTTANTTIAVQPELIKMVSFLSNGKKNNFLV